MEPALNTFTFSAGNCFKRPLYTSRPHIPLIYYRSLTSGLVTTAVFSTFMILKNLVCFLWPGLITFVHILNSLSGFLKRIWNLATLLTLVFTCWFSTNVDTESSNKHFDDSSDVSVSLKNSGGKSGLINYLLRWILHWLVSPAERKWTFQRCCQRNLYIVFIGGTQW